MQELNEAYANLILGNNFTYDKAPLVKITISELTLPISYFSMSKEYGAIAQMITIDLPNVNPSDPADTGYYNAERDNPEHNKTSNSYLDIIKAGETITVEAGYGDSFVDDCVTIFTGVIDTVNIDIDAGGNLQIIARECTSQLVDRTIYHVDSGETVYDISYPIEAGWTTFYLESTDTNPYLFQIWYDVCLRAGLTADYSEFDGNACSLRINDLNPEWFQNITGNWVDFITKLVDLMYYDNLLGDIVKFFTFEKNGTVYLANDELWNCNPGEEFQLTGTDWIELTDYDYNYRAIEDSITVRNFDNYNIEYINGVDYEYDYAKNSVRRIATGDIGAGDFVKINYTLTAWSYKPNQNVKLLKTKSHNEMYGKLRVKNDEEDLERTLNLGLLEDNTSVSTDKIKTYNTTAYITNAQLDDFLTGKQLEMKKDYINVTGDIVPILHLEAGDIIHFLIYGTITKVYKIIGLTLNYNAKTGFKQQLKCHYYTDSLLYTESYFMTSAGKYFCTSNDRKVKVNSNGYADW